MIEGINCSVDSEDKYKISYQVKMNKSIFTNLFILLEIYLHKINKWNTEIK